MRSAVVLLLLLLWAAPPARAVDDDADDVSDMPNRLRAIDEAAEHEAEHPDAGDEEPSDEEEEPDAVPVEHDDEPAAPSVPSRAGPAGSRAKTRTPARPDAATPPLKSPLADDPDDDR